MLVNFNKMLKDAYVGKYAIGSFNVYNYDTMRGVVDAAAEFSDKPLIIAFGAKYLSNMSLLDAFSMAQAFAGQFDIPICLHLDHCSKMETVFQAIRAGFGSVMYDGSALPYEENMRNTAMVCKFAHACGVSVEAELGSLAAGEASHEGSKTDREIYTDPAAARDFVENSGVDALAVSIGTVHGLYKGTPNIRLDILDAINDTLGIPLVLHGGSGIPEEAIHECIRRGICKINVNTEISVYAVNKTCELLGEAKKPHLSVVASAQQAFVKEVVQKYMRFFAGK